MSTFLYSSAAAKVVPEGSSATPDLSVSPLEYKPPDDWIKPTHNTSGQKSRLNPGFVSPSDDWIKPTHNTSGQKTRLNHGLVSPRAAGDQAEEEEECNKLQHAAAGIGSSQARTSSEGGRRLWPKYTELDNCPEGVQAKREREYEHTKPDVNRPSSPPLIHPIKPAETQTVRETGYQLPYQASGEPKVQVRNGAEPFEAPWQVDEKLPGAMKENPRISGAKLDSVREESESFSRREFGADRLLYMSTHGSADHAASFAMHSSYDHSNISSKLRSYNHSNRPNVSLLSHSSYPPDMFVNCKSAPAGSAARTWSAFKMFRRGSSEGGKVGGRVVFLRPKPRKPRSVGRMLLWPLKKIRNGYVGCMMGLEGTGDLSGMAQGGSYATSAQFFADVPLSKSDSKNYG